MLVCAGACIIMLTNQYIFQTYDSGDPVRMGAQVVSGIGFLGAGTIIVTHRNQIKGLTTAAGLWSSAGVGLALGIGFYEAAIVGAVAIFVIMTLLQRMDDKMHKKNRVLEIYLELSSEISLGDFLRQAGIECEFSDPDYLVMMVSPETTRNGLEILKNTLCRIAKKPAITDTPPAFCPGTPCQSIRDAMLSAGAVVSIEKSEGRILGAASVGCPPAVPIVVCGERIDQHAIECFRYYGISTVTVTVP
jgi:hypothetical protein